MKITLTIEIELPERLANVDPVDYEGFKVKVKEVGPEVKKEPEPVKITKEIPLPEAITTVSSKICKNCGSPFHPTWKNQRICSNECRIACKKASKKKANENFRSKLKASEPKKMPVTLHGPMTKPEGVTGIIDTSKQPDNIKPEPAGHKTVILKSGERRCRHCGDPFKIQKFDQHFCSDSCEALYRKNHKEPAMV